MLEEIRDINASLWISASAGTGKTKSLIDRIIALLFNGIPPSKILCLTYTKSAASEMLSRLSQYFHDLSTRSADELAQLGFPKLSTKLATSLYEQSMEPANWVQIKTIHSFCFDILQKFPLETGLYPGVNICDDFQRQQLVQTAIKLALEDEELHKYFECISRFAVNISEILEQHSAMISKFLSQFDDFENLYRNFFGVRDNTENALQQQIDRSAFPELSKILYKGSKKDIEKAEILANHPENFVNVFLTNEGKIRDSLCTKPLSDAYPDFFKKMQELAANTLKFVEQKKRCTAVEANVAFFQVMRVIMKNYSELKRENHLIDFDDVVSMTASLLQNIEWVMYKIDGGIDHVLVDEAQDTNPDQWEIIRLITDEFFSNYKSERTVFVVGDEKQSIYSFQGADVNLFCKMHDYFKLRSEKNGQKFHDVSLNKSYRTTGKILSFVDQVFRDSFPGIHHTTNRNPEAGFVEIVQPFENDPKDEEIPWAEYTLNRDFRSAEKKLSVYIANLVQKMIEQRVFVESKNRAARPSDFLILFQHRKFMRNVVAELKALNIPVANTNKVVLKDELIVEDLITFAEFSMLPLDELSLAIVLKSPIIGIAEDELMNWCLNRSDENLWHYALSKHPEKVHELAEIIGHANEMSAYDYFTYALNHGIRDNYLKKYGKAALDTISEFLDVVLQYENEKNYTLRGFVQWFKSFEHEIKRESFNDKNCVRLMTVHASKGLQAPFVIIADAHFFNVRSEKILKTDDGILLWNFPQKFAPTQTISELEKYSQMDIDESKRLLYVAMTRAEDFLYILSAKSQNRFCWTNFITHENLQKVRCGERLNLRVGAYRTASESIDIIKPKNHPKIPNYVFQKLPEMPTSETDATKSEQSIFGDCVHLLLQKMPQYISQPKELFEEIADTFANKFYLSEELKNAAKREALKIIFDPKLQFMFDTKSLSETSVVLDGTEKRIDKIAVKDGCLWIIDFKTGIPNETVPYTYVSQLLEYKNIVTEMLKQGYMAFDNVSGIKTAILWTKTSELVEMG